MKRMIVALMILGAYLMLSSSAASQGELFRRGAEQTVMLLNPDNLNSGGTGFAVRVGDKVYTMSNAHVCSVSKRGYMVARKGGQDQFLQILAVSENSDLCLLQRLPGYTGLELADEVSMFEGSYLVGHPLLMPISVSAGWVRARGTFPIDYCNSKKNGERLPRIIRPQEQAEDILGLLTADCVKLRSSIITNHDSKPGNSGSAVINDQAEVVGVLFAGDGQGTSLMVPLNEIKAFVAGF